MSINTISATFIRFFLAILCVNLSGLAYAGGFAVNGVSSRGATLQAFTAVADDASAIFYNPAGLTQLEGSHVEGQLQTIIEDIKFVNSSNNVTAKSHQIIPNPSLFVSTDEVDPVTLGLGIYAPFAKSTKYPSNAAVGNLDHYSTVARVDLVPTVAFKLNDCTSLGLGLVVSRMNADINILGLHEKGYGYGVSGQAGVLFDLNPTKIGFTYRGPMTINLKGNANLAQLNLSDSFTGNIKFPSILTAGIGWQVTDPWLLSANYEYEMWSVVKEYKLNFSNPILNGLGTTTLAAKNSQNIRLGTLYRLSQEDELRAGYAFVQAAVPAVNVVPAQPDVSFNSISVGYSRYANTNLRFDLGYECQIAVNRTTNNLFFPGTYSGPVHFIYLGVGYKFG